MENNRLLSKYRNIVSLFTREWIEMVEVKAVVAPNSWSPSLRGSGLKSTLPRTLDNQFQTSPSLRGSGLKFLILALCYLLYRLPLYEGVD